MKLGFRACLLLGFLILTKCYLFQKTPPPFKVHLLNEQIFENDTQFKGLSLGGLSSLSFDIKTKKFFALSDDKKNHRIYRFSLVKKEKTTYQFQLENHILLHTSKGQPLPFNMDSEALDIEKNGSFFIASEGQQIFKKPDPTQIFQFSQKGLWKNSWPTPAVFWDPKRISSFGAQANQGFESLSLDNQSNTLWVATEAPLFQDLKSYKENWIRLSEFEMNNKKLITQYPYILNPLTGLTEIIFLENKTFLTLERAYNDKKKSNFTLLFFTNCQKALNLLKKKNLKEFIPCSKKILWSSKEEKNFEIDNLEGMTLGPSIGPQKQLLVFVSDNNFSPTQKNQFLFFEIKKSH